MSALAADVSWTSAADESYLSQIFHHAPFGLAQCDSRGHITTLNPALEELIGDRAGDALSLADLIHPQDRAVSERLLRELLEGKLERFQLDSRSPADGRPLRWQAWRVPGISDKPDSAFALAGEIEENRETERRLRQAQRLEAVGRLAGGVAHDFNNILTGILLYCDLLTSSLESHPARKYAGEIRGAGLQATGLVKQLLALARPTTGEPRLLSLNEIVEGMQNLLRRLIGDNIKLEFRLDPNLGLVKMEHTQAQQILLNLALNARDAMPAGGQITVETGNCKVQVLTEAQGASSPASLPCALFAVEDNGSGMDASTRAHLFEVFFTTKGGRGTGLGLATVHDIVTSNGGLIHVDSAPDRGTRVSVLLPLVAETAPNVPIASPTPPSAGGILS